MVRLLLSVLLSSVLLTGCGDATGSRGSNGGGGTAGNTGVGGASGSSGSGGVGGTGGGTAAGRYEMVCATTIGDSDAHLLTLSFELSATIDSVFTVGSTSALTTTAGIDFGIDLANVLPGPDSTEFSAIALGVTVTGGEPARIEHIVPGLPTSTWSLLPGTRTDERITDVTHDGGSAELMIEISDFSMTVTGVPEQLYPPDGVVTLTSGSELCFGNTCVDCAEVALVDGSHPVAFPL